MKRVPCIALTVGAVIIVLCGCMRIGATSITPAASPATTAAPSPSSTDLIIQTATMEPTIQPAATSSPASPAPGSERTPNPASEMLVTGFVTSVLNNAIQIKADNLDGKDLVITMLDRAEYAAGVSKEFKTGNYVRVITSNALAKTLPERTAARLILQNTVK